MSGVLHPVGPEQPRTYWQRRLFVVAAVLAVIAVVIMAVLNLSGGGDQQQAVPAASTSAVATPGAAVETPASEVTPSVSAKAPAPPKVSPTAPAPPKVSPTAPAPPKVSPTAKARPTQTTPTKGPTPACTPSEVRVTLRGDQSLEVEQKTTFTVSLINGGPTTCIVSLTPSTFELKVYSGTDRIWSTDDCATSMKPIEKAVASESEVAWTTTWNGRRSAKGCKNRSEIPLPGTYFATAQLKGADPVQLRMTLRG